MISVLAECAAKQSIREFEAALETPTDSLVKFDAWRGLLRAGKKEPLKEIRGLVDGESATDTEESQKAYAINLLGEFGTEEDVKGLEKLLNSDFRIFVAETLIKRLSSSDRGIE